MSMSRVILCGVAVLALIGPAGAADLAPTYKAPATRAAPAMDWSGFYLGINGGYGRSNNCWDLNGANMPVLAVGPNPIFIGLSGAANIAEGCNNGNGAVAGGQVGYRYQLNSFVFGLEAQGDWANLKGSNTSSVFNGLTIPPGGALSLVNSSKVDAIGMFTGQIGYAWGPVLWYVKGGAAVTNNEYDGTLDASFVNPNPKNTRFNFTLNATDHASAVRFGEVIGTGVDVMFAPGWSLGVEYNHLFMGSQQVGFAYTGASGTGLLAGVKSPAGVPSRNESINGDIDMATVRLNYSFGH